MFTVTVVDKNAEPAARAKVNFSFTEDTRMSGDEYTDRNGVAEFHEGFEKPGEIKVFVDGDKVGTKWYMNDTGITVSI